MQLGYWLIHWLIASDYDINSNFTIILFCLTFGLSVMALGLLIFEIMEIEDDSDRIIKWWVTLGLIVILCIVIIPALLIRKLITRLGCGKKSKIIIGFLLSGGYIVIFFYFFDLRELLELTRQLDFITKIGTVMIGVLSGFGAVNCPFAYFQFISMNIKQVQDVKKEIISNIYFLIKEIEKAATRIALLDYQHNPKLHKQPVKSFWGYIVNMFSSNSKSLEEQEREDLKNEINQLKEIHKEFFEYYKEYQEEEQRYFFSKTLYGKFLRRLAWIVFVYCIYKMLMSIINIVLGRKKSIDPINRILKVILPFFGFTLDQETYETLAIYGTFIFMGYLMISNVRSFSLNLVNMFNSFMGIALLQKMPAEIMVYILAEIFGVYLLTTVILLQISVPERFLVNLKQFTEQIDILGHYKYFDFYFLASGMASFFIIYFNFAKRNQKLKSFQKQKQYD